jgi:hypothetical protein
LNTPTDVPVKQLFHSNSCLKFQTDIGNSMSCLSHPKQCKPNNEGFWSQKLQEAGFFKEKDDIQVDIWPYEHNEPH